LRAHRALRLNGFVSETINGCTVYAPPTIDGPLTFGPAELGGSYTVLSGLISPGEPGPPLHLHPHTDESFYVAAGEATFQLGSREVRVGPGGFVFVPRGTPHTVGNPSGDPILGLILISPGDAEHVFEPVVDAAG
jgi:mannose-6-phosphate isomerase-like protein (cupin superfamily)